MALTILSLIIKVFSVISEEEDDIMVKPIQPPQE
jgi:hypothetical protein